MGNIEENMIIKATLSKIYNGDLSTSVGFYLVFSFEDAFYELIPVVKEQGVYFPTGSIVKVGEGSHINLGEWVFVDFVKTQYVRDTQRTRLHTPSKNERISSLLEGISSQDIIEFLKGRTNDGTAD